MIFWSLTSFAAMTAFAFRAAPFVFKNSTVLNNTTSSFYRFLSYSAQAMMGVIIYDTAFKKAGVLTLIEQFQPITMLKLFLLIVTFACVAKTRQTLPIFFLAMLIYSAAVVYQHGGL